MPDFDPNWEHGHVTRSGRKARIICTNRDDSSYPIVALITPPAMGPEYSLYFTAKGKAYIYSTGHHNDDLINASMPVGEIEVWVLRYLNAGRQIDFSVFMTIGDAVEFSANYSGVEPISLTPVTCKVGQLMGMFK